MSVQSEINRLATAKTAIGTAIAGKGVAVPSGTKLDGMAALIDGIEQGSDPVLQSKSVAPSENEQTVKPDSGYDGLSQVSVGAISKTYVGSSVPKQAAQTITPGTADKTISSGRYLTGTQTIKGDANLVAGNIKSGVSIFGVNGTHEGGGGSGGSVATCTISFTDYFESGTLYYSDGTQIIEDNEILHLFDTPITVAKNSIIYIRNNDFVTGFTFSNDAAYIIMVENRNVTIAITGDCAITPVWG